MRQADIWAGSFVAVLALLILVVVIPWQIEPAPEGFVSPRLVPQITMSIVALLSVLQVIGALRRTGPDEPMPVSRGEIMALLRIGADFALALALFLWAGPLAAAIALIVGTLLVLGERRLWLIALMPAVLIVAVWYLFYHVLGTAIV